MSILKSALEGVGGAVGLGAVVKGGEALAGAVGGKKKTAAAGGHGVIGGTVVGRSHGMLLVQVGSKMLLVATRRRSRRHSYHARSGKMDRLMELAMIKAITR